MDSNAERAQHGDTIEVTNPARVDFGKRMQVATHGDTAVTALDNRMRVKIDHGDYRVVKRCGKPATADLSKAQTVQTPAPVEIPPATVKPRAPAAVSDADVANLEAAIYDVPVTRKETPTGRISNPDKSARGTQQLDAAASATAIGVKMKVDELEVKVDETTGYVTGIGPKTHTPSAAAPAAHDSHANAPAEHGTADKPGPGKPETAQAGTGDVIELLSPIAGYQAGAQLKVIRRISTTTVTAVDAIKGDWIYVLDGAYTIVKRVYETQDHLRDALAYGLGVERVTVPPAEWLRPDLSHLTQEQIDERTTKPEAYVGVDLAGTETVTLKRPVRIARIQKHSHYFKPCPFDHIDVYRVLERFNVADPCLQHAIKKLLVAGGRGAKDIGQDVQEAIDTLERFKAMRAEEAA